MTNTERAAAQLVTKYGFTKAPHHAPAYMKPLFMFWNVVSERSGAMSPSLYPAFTTYEMKSTLSEKQRRKRRKLNRISGKSRVYNLRRAA